MSNTIVRKVQDTDKIRLFISRNFSVLFAWGKWRKMAPPGGSGMRTALRVCRCMEDGPHLRKGGRSQWSGARRALRHVHSGARRSERRPYLIFSGRFCRVGPVRALMQAPCVVSKGMPVTLCAARWPLIREKSAVRRQDRRSKQELSAPIKRPDYAAAISSKPYA